MTRSGSSPSGNASHANSQRVVVADKVSKRYGEVVALAPLDLAFDAGEWTALVGHNGSGKSTFLRLASGLLDPSDGSVLVNGEPAGSLTARSALTYVPDAPVLYDDLSVAEHLEYLGRLHGVVDWKPRSMELLDRFGLTHRSDDLPSGFSRGLRQKTALAIALLRETEALLIDEPFSGLDQPGKEALVEIVSERRARGTAVLMATHDLDVIERVDRCVVLRDGALAHVGTLGAREVIEFVR